MTARRYDPFAMSLHRDPENGLLLGVCAGLAETFGWRAVSVRVVALIALIFFTMPAVLVYLVAGVLLPRKRLTYYGRAERDLWSRRRGRRVEA